MPRATPGPAADAAITPPVDLPPLPGPYAGMPRWRFVGGFSRVYTSVPVTVSPGDVVAWPTAPAADGCWEPTDSAVTKRPDNAPTELAEEA
jgi:hypothetical protein